MWVNWNIYNIIYKQYILYYYYYYHWCCCWYYCCYCVIIIVVIIIVVIIIVVVFVVIVVVVIMIINVCTPCIRYINGYIGVDVVYNSWLFMGSLIIYEFWLWGSGYGAFGYVFARGFLLFWLGCFGLGHLLFVLLQLFWFIQTHSNIKNNT